jgi:hypothetical protein
MTDIAEWLDEIGLGKYAEAFRANDIDFDVLPELGADELKELGVSLGDRQRLLKAIVARSGPAAESPASSAPGAAAPAAAAPAPAPVRTGAGAVGGTAAADGPVRRSGRLYRALASARRGRSARGIARLS